MQLTEAEKFYIKRRRQNKTQKEIAKDYKVQYFVIHDWERGEVNNIPKVNIKNPEMNELCMIFRRRKKYTIKDFAKAMGVSHVTLIKMEKDKNKCQPIVDFIKKKFKVRLRK